MTSANFTPATAGLAGSDTPPPASAPRDTPAGARLVLGIEGMHCAACSARLEKVLGRVEGVAAARVDLASERARIDLADPPAEEGALFRAVEKAGFTAVPVADEESRLIEEDRKAAYRLRRDRAILALAALLAAPLVAPMLAAPLGLEIALPGWLALLLASAVQFGIGGRFYVSAWRSLKGGGANMDVLVALGTSAAWGASAFTVLSGGSGPLYFESAAVVITLVLLGKLLEARAKRSAAGAIRALMNLRPATARIERGDGVVEIAADLLDLGDVMVVRPGERFAADGRVLDGHSQADESLLTGESRPLEKGPGDAIIGGAVNGSGRLKVEVTALGTDSALAGIVRAVAEAQAARPRVQALVDRISTIFVPTIVAVSLLTLAVWSLGLGQPQAGFAAAVAVLVVACPCALGLATPTALMVGTGVAARHGLLIRDPDGLSRARGLAAVAFDKTGTLTEGKPTLAGRHAAPGVDPAELLRLAAAAQQGSEHPLARAVLAAHQGSPLPQPESFEALPGRGLSATVEGRRLLIGGDRLMTEKAIDTTPLDTTADHARHQGHSLLWIAEENTGGARLLGLLTAHDPLKPGAAQALQALKARGLKVAVLSGDSPDAVAATLKGLPVDLIRAHILPADKADEIARLRHQVGGPVAMVGDGVNDAPALAAADLSIAIGQGSDVALESAALTLMHGEPQAVATSLDLARAIHRKIAQNLFWAFGYNVLAVPAAAAGYLSPMIAGAAMAFSSVSVVSNALLLRRFRADTRGEGKGALPL
ncbi:heavy metal translocating P-type ATPase [Roseospirillum parvum]|uniref:Cu+-exporting ATPase n=1 Tax=Roseospirillum parvum TaxID=83401 RepID=A0A1G7ZH20_9PROT|nr:heavy metal translocating P-type ATPase [Roseospirillum parvum]SDH07905.1 Cu+-exporting ATPase [Roseospirillum parvum]